LAKEKFWGVGLRPLEGAGEQCIYNMVWPRWVGHILCLYMQRLVHKTFFKYGQGAGSGLVRIFCECLQ